MDAVFDTFTDVPWDRSQCEYYFGDSRRCLEDLRQGNGNAVGHLLVWVSEACGTDGLYATLCEPHLNDVRRLREFVTVDVGETVRVRIKTEAWGVTGIKDGIPNCPGSGQEGTPIGENPTTTSTSRPRAPAATITTTSGSRSRMRTTRSFPWSGRSGGR